MVKDAESHRDEDKKRRDLVEAKNQADALIHTTEKTLADVGDQVSAEEKGAIETAVASLKTALEGEDLEDIRAKSETLMQASMKLGEAAYKAQQDAAGGSADDPQPASGADDEVVDADFEEVDDDKKSSSG